MRTITAVKAAIVWVPPLTRAPLPEHQASIGIVSRNKVILTYRYFTPSIPNFTVNQPFVFLLQRRRLLPLRTLRRPRTVFGKLLLPVCLRLSF